LFGEALVNFPGEAGVHETPGVQIQTGVRQGGHIWCCCCVVCVCVVLRLVVVGLVGACFL
jgi:hypothetical protein